MKSIIDQLHYKNIILLGLGILVLISRFLTLHEPFFYGQNYNFCIESIVSIPLLAIGVPFYMALPIASSLLGVFPFFLFSFVLFRKGYTINATLFLLILLTLPVEYDIITSITRGFVSGLFFCSFLIFPLLDPSKKRSFVILSLSVSVAYIVNPNSLIFSFPVCLYLLFKNYNKPAFYLISLATSIPALFIQYVSEQFYVNHPDYLVHPSWILEYSFDKALNGLSHLDKFFRYLTPVFWKGNWVVVLVVVILGFIAIKKDWKKGLSILLCSLLILLLLGVNKINDDIGVIYLSSTRMFLAIPLLLGLAVFWTKNIFSGERKWQIMIISVGISVFLIKANCYSNVVGEHTEKRNFGPVAIKKLDELKSECAVLQQITFRYNVDLVVFIPDQEHNTPFMEFYDYGCPVLESKFPVSVMNIYEKRTWVLQKEKNSTRTNLLLFNQNTDRIEDYKTKLDCEIINTDPNMILITHNDKTLLELSEIFDFPLKGNPN